MNCQVWISVIYNKVLVYVFQCFISLDAAFCFSNTPQMKNQHYEALTRIYTLTNRKHNILQVRMEHSHLNHLLHPQRLNFVCNLLLFVAEAPFWSPTHGGGRLSREMRRQVCPESGRRWHCAAILAGRRRHCEGFPLPHLFAPCLSRCNTIVLCFGLRSRPSNKL